MMYENAQYIAYNGANTCIRVDIDGVTWFVPLADDNTYYANIMQLVAEGKLTIAPAEGAAK
jgi:hypothetical protein